MNLPKTTRDSVNLRGPGLDSFTRRLKDGAPENVNFEQIVPQRLLLSNEDKNCLVQMQNSKLPLWDNRVTIKSYDGKFISLSNGVIIGRRAVLTCAHGLADGTMVTVLHAGKTYEASVYILTKPTQVGLFSSLSVPWPTFDLAILVTEMPYQVECFPILSIDQPAHLNDLIVANGMPIGASKGNCTNYFTGRDLAYLNKTLGEANSRSLLKEIIQRDFPEKSLAIYGYVLSNSEEDTSLLQITCSTVESLSGSPIYSLNEPERLIGILIGGYEGMVSANMAMDLTNKHVVNLINDFIRSM